MAVVEGSFLITTSSSVQFFGTRKRTARCPGAFTFTPLGGPAWEGTIRREPEIVVEQAHNDSPSSMAFTQDEKPDLGANVQLDMQDGYGVLAGGTVQSFTERYEGQVDQPVFDLEVADYLWLLNKRRPFGCYENTSATLVIQDMFVRFGPFGFTAEIQPGLAPVTVSLDGSRTFTECLSLIVNSIPGGARFRVNKDRILQVFTVDSIPSPPVVNDDNDNLLRDLPLSITRDISQIRNRVFVRGASAKLLAPSSPGAVTLEMDGLDIFSATGGLGIIGCDVFSYGGVQRDLIYPPPDASAYKPVAIDIVDHLGRFGELVVGPIKTNVRYRTAYVVDGKLSPLADAREYTLFAMKTPVSVAVDSFTSGAGAVPAGNRQWTVGFRATDGTLNYNTQQGVSASQVTAGKYVIEVTADFLDNDFRPAEVVLFRQVDFGAGLNYHEVTSVPYVDGASPFLLEDALADESLGDLKPSWPDTPAFLEYEEVGMRVYIIGASIPMFAAQQVGASEVRIYREEQSGGGFWTVAEQILSLDPNEPVEDFYEDTKETTVSRYHQGTAIPGVDPTAPPPIQPKVRLTLFGVSGLDESHLEGDDVHIWTQRDDFESQLAMALIEGGDGVHEFFIADPSLRSKAQLEQRADAELELFGDPIVTVKYSTLDETLPGALVEFDLSAPEYVGSLRAVEVEIAKIHIATGRGPQYNVTASSVKFTLQDFLRRLELRN